MTTRRSQRTATLPLGIVTLLLLVLVPDASAAAQVEETLTPEDIEAARSAPLFQSDDVLEFTLHADFNTIRRRDREQDAEERPASLSIAAGGSEATIELKAPDAWQLAAQFPELPVSSAMARLRQGR